VEHLSHGFRNEEHRRQWAQTIKTFAAALRDKPIDKVHTADILAVLTPIWQSKHVTASRLRGRIERVLDAATAKGLRSGENPARWRGHLDHLLSSRQNVAQRHHPAMPYTEVPAFVAELRGREGISALALDFCILNASRSGEVLGARWAEMIGRPKSGSSHPSA
jgi:integrase